MSKFYLFDDVGVLKSLRILTFRMAFRFLNFMQFNIIWGLRPESIVGENMKKREIIGPILLFFLIMMIAVPASATTLTVDDSGGADYTSIQEAVDSANESDTILVYSGTYAGDISVNKKLVLKGVDTGNGIPVVDGSDRHKNGFSLFADEITLDGFEIIRCDWGIDVYSAGNNIVNNKVRNSFSGIWVGEIYEASQGHVSSNNYLEGNDLFDNYYGISFSGSEGNILRDNNMMGNDYNFILFEWYPYYNDVDISNLVDGKSLYYLVGESDRVIDSSLNVGAVFCIDCNNIVIKGLNIKNSGEGILLCNTSNSTVQDNSIISCDRGLRVLMSNGNTISGNQFTSSDCGLSLEDSNDNIFRNNRMNSNWVNFFVTGSENNDLDFSNTVDGKFIYYLFNESGTVIDASSNAGVVYCRDCSNITIKDLSLKNSHSGISLEHTDNCIIENCEIDECVNGIDLYGCSENNIIGNIINIEHGLEAIDLIVSDNNFLAGNILNMGEGGLYGVDLTNSHGNLFVRNRITAHEILISIDEYVDNNTFYLNDFRLVDDSLGTVGASAPVDSSIPSLKTESVFRNFERERPDKFFEEYKEADEIRLTVSASTSSGGGGSGGGGINTGLLNSSKTLNYSYQGNEFTGYLGNYWNYYEDSDSEGDGIGDSPCLVNIVLDYEEVVNESDMYPLMMPASNYVVEGETFFTSDFSVNVTLGPAPLAVRFESLSGRSTYWIWDFNGDGHVDSTEKNPVYVYETPGIYTVSLTTGNTLGEGHKEIEGLITVTAPPKITSFAPESAQIKDYEGDTREFEVALDQISNLTWYFDGEALYSNLSVQVSSCTLLASVEAGEIPSHMVHELAVLAENENGTCRHVWEWVVIPSESPENVRNRNSFEVNITGEGPVFYGFKPENNFSILNLSFEASGSLGNVTATVEFLNKSSANVPVLPPGKVYRHLNIRVGSYDFGKFGIGEATVLFRIEKAWFNETGVNASTIRLCRFNSGVWERLPTKIVDGPDPNFYYFEAITPGFSSFAIASPLIKAVSPEPGDTIYLESIKDKEQIFGVEASRTCNLSWYINGSLAQEDSNTTYAEYKNKTAPVGVYNVTVFASGDNESDQWTWLWNVLHVPDSSSRKSSGGSGGGGGGGGSPEPASNVEIKELAQSFVTNGKPVSFNFIRNATCVNYVKFDSLRTAGKLTTVVEMLKGPSKLVPELPPAKVYKNVNIWVGNSGFATPENINNSLVGFRVEKAWMEEAGVDVASIILWKYEDSEWKQLDTGKVGEDSSSFFFESGTSDFSSFAITGGPVTSKIGLGQLEGDSDQKALNNDVSKSEGVESENASDENRLPEFGLIGTVSGLLFFVAFGKRNRFF